MNFDFTFTDRGIIDDITWGLDKWASYMAKVGKYLAMRPEDYNPDAWITVTQIHHVLLGAGYALLLVCFFIGLFREFGSFVELKRPEIALKIFLRYLLAKAAIDMSMELLELMREIAMDIIDMIIPYSSESAGYNIPESLVKAVENLNFIQEAGIAIINLFAVLIITGLAFSVLLTVIGRFFQIYVMTIISPVILPTFASRTTSSMGSTFLRSYFGACAEGILILVACIVYTSFWTSEIVIDSSSSAFGQVFDYISQIIFNMLILSALVKGSDRLMRDKFGI